MVLRALYLSLLGLVVNLLPSPYHAPGPSASNSPHVPMHFLFLQSFLVSSFVAAI